MIAAARAIAACLLLAAGVTRAAPEGSPWGAGYFPDVPLVTQDGRVVRFYSDLVKDRFVLVDFIFTRCRKACPLETANLARVQRLLGARVGRDIFMYSITLDPGHDTPEVLKRYAQAFRAGPGWLFLTGQREDIDLIRARLGDRSRVENHAVSLALGNDPAGQWTSLSAADDPGFLAVTIDGWMTADPGRHAPVQSYAEAPRPPRPTAGEELFRQRCAACHDAERAVAVGPDLRGVTRHRDRGWLARWIRDPERMIADGDPLALQLAHRYGDLPMPTLGLTEGEVASLLTYLEDHSTAAGEERAGEGAARAARAPAARP